MALLKVKLHSESKKNWEDAIQNAVLETSKPLRNIRFTYVKNLTAGAEKGKIRINCKIASEKE